jgi:hypothetical protein
VPDVKYPPGNGDLIFYKAVSAVSSQSIAIPPATARVGLFITGTGGMTSGFPNGVLCRPNNDSGANYKWSYGNITNIVVAPTPLAASSATTPMNTAMLLALTGAVPATDVTISAIINVAVTAGTTRGYKSEMWTLGPADATSYSGDIGGCWTDTTTTVTSLNILFGTAFTGKIYAYFYQA